MLSTSLCLCGRFTRPQGCFCRDRTTSGRIKAEFQEHPTEIEPNLALDTRSYTKRVFENDRLVRVDTPSSVAGLYRPYLSGFTSA